VRCVAFLPTPLVTNSQGVGNQTYSFPATPFGFVLSIPGSFSSIDNIGSAPFST
jgi:hypothetical protein